MTHRNYNEFIDYPRNVIEEMAEMIKINNPVFIYGDYGKTEFIKYMVPNIIIVDSRELLEPRNLSGFHAVVDNNLVFIKGLLVNAMSSGHKICFRKIDYNQNLLNFLRPVINGKEIISNDGETIRPHKDFRIFFTCNDIFEIRNVSFIGNFEFTIFDVLNIFYNQKLLVSEAYDFINLNKSLKCGRDHGIGCEGVCFKNNFECTCKPNKLCKEHFRMLCMLRKLLDIDDASRFRQNLYQSIVNVFLKHDSSQLLEKLYVNCPPLILPNMLFAKTLPVESTLRSLIFNIQKRTPTLLVGETGAGKVP